MTLSLKGEDVFVNRSANTKRRALNLAYGCQGPKIRSE